MNASAARTATMQRRSKDLGQIANSGQPEQQKMEKEN
jgi:hypothetical protein